MTNFDLNKIEQLLKERKIKEVAELINAGLPDLTKEEEGEVYAGLALAYMKVMNSIDEDHINFLETTISRIEDIKARKDKLEDQIKLANIRRDLDSKN